MGNGPLLHPEQNYFTTVVLVHFFTFAAVGRIQILSCEPPAKILQ